MSRTPLAVLLALVFVAGRAEADPGQVAATGVAEALAAGDVRAVASSLHYPPTYNEAERAEDVAGVSKSLTYLIDRFGNPTTPRLATEQRVFYHVGTSGGDLPYWESISPYKNRLVVFDVDFTKVGRGILMVELLSLDEGAPELVMGVEFGLLSEEPGSKEHIVRHFEGMLSYMGVALPPDFHALAMQQIQPLSSQPAAMAE